jgi:hypothetical protein
MDMDLVGEKTAMDRQEKRDFEEEWGVWGYENAS